MNVVWAVYVFFIILTVNGISVERFCSVNEEYRWDSYESTCDKVLHRSWTLKKWDGCFCKSGFIRDENTNSCITVESCSDRVCKEENTELNLFGRLTVCNGSGISSSITYPLGYFPICTCKTGYAIKIHRCIPKSECT
ncbi:uncharacterized protein [Centruroides vittatus]|uniref:uncharacterized protein n=1 Tax=Centruroides vittatus TaxID=120091 RepID=UPI00350F7797